MPTELEKLQWAISSGRATKEDRRRLTELERQEERPYTQDLAFDEGPFFLIEATVYPHMNKRAIIWSTDETTARNVFAFKLNLPTTYCIISHLGDLKNVKSTLRLTNTQTSDLHRDGYLRL